MLSAENRYYCILAKEIAEMPDDLSEQIVLKDKANSPC